MDRTHIIVLAVAFIAIFGVGLGLGTAIQPVHVRTIVINQPSRSLDTVNLVVRNPTGAVIYNARANYGLKHATGEIVYCFDADYQGREHEKGIA